MLYCTVKSKMTTITIETSMFPYIIKCTSSIRLKWNVWSGAFSACIKPTHYPQVIHGSSSLIPVSGVQLTPCTESLCLSCYIFLLNGFWDLDSCLQISRGCLWHYLLLHTPQRFPAMQSIRCIGPCQPAQCSRISFSVAWTAVQVFAQRHSITGF